MVRISGLTRLAVGAMVWFNWGASPVRAAVSAFPWGEFQTVDFIGDFPATGDNNLDKFDTAGTAHNTVAPFDTTIYVRASTNLATPARPTCLYLYFDLSGMSPETLVGSTLEFSAYSLNDQAQNDEDILVSQLANAWNPAGMPDPVFDPVIVGSAVNGGSVVSGTGTDQYDSGLVLDGNPVYRNTTTYSIDITSIVANWHRGDANHGFFLELGDSQSENQGIGIDPGTLFLNVDQVPNPGVTLSTASPVVVDAYTVNVDFTESMTGLELLDFGVVNGTASNLAGSDAQYTVLITPTAPGEVSVTLPADAAQAVAGELGNVASNTLTTDFDPPIPPTVIMTTTFPGVFEGYTVDVVFNKEVTGLENTDFDVTNGAASDLAGTGVAYTVLITPTAPGDVTVVLPADAVTDLNDGLGNEASAPLVTTYDPALSALVNLRNGDLNMPVARVAGTGGGNLPWTFDPTSNSVLFNGVVRSEAFANAWIETSLSRGFRYDPDRGAGGSGDGALIEDPAVVFNQKPRSALYFVDDGKQSQGQLASSIDLFLDDNTATNALQFQVELYAWQDGEVAPQLSSGGATANDPTYNVTELGDAIAILQTQVLAESVADATWETVSLGSIDVGAGYDNYVWRIGILGATPTDLFAFDNVVVSAVAGPRLTGISRVTGGGVTIFFTSPTASVDVYRSEDLQSWGAPLETDNASGQYVDPMAPPGPAYYKIISSGAAPP